MAAKRKATATWSGDLASGSGSVDLTSSGAVSALPVSWAARSEDSAGGKTSPEELIAAAYAACYCMALSVSLSRAGNKPERLNVEATSTFEKIDQGFAFTTLAVRVRGNVPGIDDAAFKQAADTASRECPVSKALKGNVEIS
ncbi:MAG: OsmC family peroxiredoxin, partial [Planctomycetaceae bacterium]